jgi:hypothetical protein
MSAHQQPTGGGLPWSGAELARAKALRRVGYTHGTIAGMLRAEFATERTGSAVQKLFVALRQRGLVVETVSDADRAAAREKARQAELAVANLVRRRCLRCRDHFDSWGPGNQVCGDCKSSEAWR